MDEEDQEETKGKIRREEEENETSGMKMRKRSKIKHRGRRSKEMWWKIKKENFELKYFLIALSTFLVLSGERGHDNTLLHMKENYQIYKQNKIYRAQNVYFLFLYTHFAKTNLRSNKNLARCA
jgi:hypothetical protein